jgi:2-alkenal reductase
MIEQNCCFDQDTILEVRMKRKIILISLVLVVAMILTSCSLFSAIPGLVTSISDSSSDATTATQEAIVTNEQATTVVKNITTVDLQDAYEQIYENVNPSVVNIRVVQKVTSNNQSYQYYYQFPGFQPYNQQQQQVPDQVEGAGFIYDTAGHIITNNHVVSNADRIIVTFSDGTQTEATLVGTDAGTDLAVIQVDAAANASLLKPVTLADSTALKVGQIVVAIGSPFQLQGSLTTGIISALGRTFEETSDSGSTTYSIPDIIQTDAAINHGNSGGPLLDIDGNVVGVNTAIASTSDSNAGVGYAIPSEIVKLVADSLIASGNFPHPYIGISTTDMNLDLSKAMNLPENTRGIMIVSVGSGTPASKADLQGYSGTTTIDGYNYYIGGDVVTSIDGHAIKEYNDLASYLVTQTKVGQTINLDILRNGEKMTIQVTLIDRPASE